MGDTRGDTPRLRKCCQDSLGHVPVHGLRLELGAPEKEAPVPLGQGAPGPGLQTSRRHLSSFFHLPTPFQTAVYLLLRLPL